MLLQAGLTPNEAKVYNLLIEHGELTPPRITELSNISRQNSYAVLKSLIKKDLVEEIDRKKKLTYYPKHPQKLVEYMEGQRKEMEMAEKVVSAAIPSLASLFQFSSGKPGITYFEGIDGIKKIQEGILKERPKEVCVFRSIYDKQKLDKFLTGFIKREATLGIKTRIISPKIVTPEVLEKDKRYNRERKYVPEELFKLETQISVYNDQTAFFTYGKKLMGFVISSKDVAQTLRTIFELVWNSKGY